MSQVFIQESVSRILSFIETGFVKYHVLNFFPTSLLSFFASKGGGEDSAGQRYSADPTGLLAERGAKADKDKDGYMTAMRDKNNSGDGLENFWMG